MKTKIKLKGYINFDEFCKDYQINIDKFIFLWKQTNLEKYVMKNIDSIEQKSISEKEFLQVLYGCYKNEYIATFFLERFD